MKKDNCFWKIDFYKGDFYFYVGEFMILYGKDPCSRDLDSQVSDPTRLFLLIDQKGTTVKKKINEVPPFILSPKIYVGSGSPDHYYTMAKTVQRFSFQG